MENGQASEYTYSIEDGYAGAGRRVWRWVIHRRDTGAEMAQGTSIQSRDDARITALAVIRQLERPANPISA
jgi:hypothetical protein